MTSAFGGDEKWMHYKILGLTLISASFTLLMVLYFHEIAEMGCIPEIVLSAVLVVIFVQHITTAQEVIIADGAVVYIEDLLDASSQKLVPFTSVKDIRCKYDKDRIKGVYVLLKDGTEIYFDLIAYSSSDRERIFKELLRRWKTWKFREGWSSLKGVDDECKRRLEEYPYRVRKATFNNRFVLKNRVGVLSRYAFICLTPSVMTLAYLIFILGHSFIWLQMLYVVLTYFLILAGIYLVLYVYTEEIFIDDGRIIIYTNRKLKVSVDMWSIAAVGNYPDDLSEPHIYIETNGNVRVYEAFAPAIREDCLKSLFTEIVHYRNRYGFDVLDTLGWLRHRKY